METESNTKSTTELQPGDHVWTTTDRARIESITPTPTGYLVHLNNGTQVACKATKVWTVVE